MLSPQVNVRLEGKVFIILRDFLFSKVSFSFVIELPFLKFIKYIFTLKSCRANAVKKLWSGQVVEILYILFFASESCF